MTFEAGKRFARWTILLTALETLIVFGLLLFSLIVISSLGVENYGIFGAASVINLLGMTFLSSFLLEPSTKLISSLYGKKDFDSLSKAIGAIIAFLFIFSLLFVVVYLIITPFIATQVYNRPYLIEYMVLLFPRLIINPYNFLFRRLLRSLNSYGKVTVGRVFDGPTYIISVLSMVFIDGWTVRALVLGNVIHTCISMIILFVLTYTELRKQKIPILVNIKKNYLLELTSLGKYYLVSDSFYSFLGKLDELVIPIFVSDTLIGYYYFAKNLLLRFRSLFDIMRGLLYPTFSELLEISGPESVKKFLSKGIDFSLFYVFMFTQFIFFFPKEIILVVSTVLVDISDYLPAAPILAIFSFLLIAEGLRSVLNAYYSGLAKVSVILKANSIGLMTGILLIVPFTLIFNIYGAAFVNILAYFSIVGYYLYVTHKKETPISKGKILLRICGSLLVAGSIRLFYEIMVYFGILSANMDNLLSIFIFTFIGLLYIFLDFVLMSLMNVLTYEEILLMERIAGSNKVTSKVANIIKWFYKLLNRTEKRLNL
ncbi:MAG: polysaccharide biosynthesis C-terminal domain-containing protein [Promethearchaeota archaeon]